LWCDGTLEEKAQILWDTINMKKDDDILYADDKKLESCFKMICSLATKWTYEQKNINFNNTLLNMAI